MRKLFFVLLSVILFSCNENKNTTTNASQQNGQDKVAVDTPPPGNIQQEREAIQTETTQIEEEQPRIAESLDGKYRKLEKGVAASDCNCNCIEIEFDRPTEWCIDKDKLYITARTQKSGENSADVYFVSVSREIQPDREMPWEDFDTNAPVATITFTQDGGAELDWIGFSTNGKIATEYALFGKKTLEGTYKKE